MDARVEDGRLHIGQQGVLAPVMKRVAGGVLGVIDGERVISEDPLIVSTWLPPVGTRAWDRLARAQIKGLVGRPVPEQVTVSITEECPNQCEHCALPDTGQHSRLSLREVRRVVGEALDLGTTLVIFDGGEPTTHPDLVEMVRGVDDRAVSTVFTSGAGFTRELADELAEAGLYAVNVSIDSPHPGEHNRVRGRRGVYEGAMRAIDNALSADLLVNIYVVLSRFNLDSLWALFDLARDRGVHELSFYEIVPTGRWMDEKPLTDGEMRRYYEFAEEAREMGGVRVHSIPHVIRDVGCFAGRRWLHVTPEGRVWPCACVPRAHGNVHEEPLKDIWRSVTLDPLYDDGDCIMRDPSRRRQVIGKS